MTIEEILETTVDEEEDYHRLTDQGIKSSLQPESLGLVLVRQPIGVLANLIGEFEEASRCSVWEMKRVDEEEEIGTGIEVVPQVKVPQGTWQSSRKSR